MITLNSILDYIKETVTAPHYYAEKADLSQEKFIGVYQAQSQPESLGHYGEHAHVKRVNILVHWGRTSNEAEKTAYEVYDLFSQKSPVMNGIQTHIIPLYEAPISLGLDEDGIIEYSVIADIYF